MVARATGDSASVKGLSIPALAMNSALQVMTIVQAAGSDIFPVGISRCAVRSLRASIFRSTMRLKPIAALRAKTMQRIMKKSFHAMFSPPSLHAMVNPIRAKGIANSVWEKRTMWSHASTVPVD